MDMQRELMSINEEGCDLSELSALEVNSHPNAEKFHWYQIRFDLIIEFFLTILTILFLTIGIIEGINSFYFQFSSALFHMVLGCVTNQIVLYALFHKVCIIPGSGSFTRCIGPLKTFISSIIYTQIITYNDQHLLMSDITSSTVSSLDISHSIESYVNSKEFDDILIPTINEYMETVQGFNLKLIYNHVSENLKEAIKLRIKTEFEKLFPKIVGLVTTEPFYSPDKFHSDVITYINNNLQSLGQEQLTQIIQVSIKESIQLYNLWGFFIGGIAVLYLNFLHLAKHWSN